MKRLTLHPQTATEKIVVTLQEHGVEFLAGGGVRLEDRP
jgi:hypothetical protein